MRLLLLIAVLAGLAIPATALAQAAPPGSAEIHEFYLHPSTTQAGGHPDVQLMFRFCDATPHVIDASHTTPIVITTDRPHGIANNSLVSVRGVRGNLAADVDFATAHVLSPTSFQMYNSSTPIAGSGDYTGGGWVSPSIGLGCAPAQAAMQISRFLLQLPPGFLGNPMAVSECPYGTWVASIQPPGNGCPISSQVGQSNTRTVQQTLPPSPIIVPTSLFRVPTNGLEPARLGTDKLVGDPPGPIPIQISLRTSGDRGINSAVIDLPKNLGGPQAVITEIETVLCGYAPCTIPGGSFSSIPTSVIPSQPQGGRPFFVNPTSCELPAISQLSAWSWAHRDVEADATSTDLGPGNTSVPSFTPTGCQNVPFDAGFAIAPEAASDGGTTAVGQPSAEKVTISYPDYANDPIWQSALRNADVALPEGMTLSPGGGVGLEACSFDQFGVDSAGHQVNDDPPTCPDGSQIGTLSVDTPVLPAGSLSGKVFFGPVSAAGRPTPDQPWKLFLYIEGAGLRIKLVGNVDVSESGQIHNVFVDQPEVPFTALTLHLRGGSRAVLANPEDCSKHDGNVVLTGWADTPSQGVVKKTTSTPSVTPTGCPSGNDKPFAPQIVSAGSDPEQAGANTTSFITITRNDGEDDIKNLKLSLPVGAVGSLAAVPECPIAQARTGDCPDGSKIGTVKSTVGTGDSLLTATGSLYLAEPSQPTDAATLALVVPAKAGPIDLGKVVVLNRVMLRDTDSGVDAVTSDIPATLGGVRLHVRKIEIRVDRPGFFLNPTGCEPRPLIATFTGYGGEQSTSTMNLNAKGCENLPFDPKLTMISGARGQNAQLQHPPLTTIVTQAPGEANIKSSTVILPDLIRPNAVEFNAPGGLCSDAQFAQNACPKPSLVGSVRVITPVLPFQLSGPVYVVQEVGSVLPKLYFVLQGPGIRVVLKSRNSFLHAIFTVNTLENVPDVPQSYFELKVKGGPGGILNNFYDACGVAKAHRKIDYTFNGQNGKQVKKVSYLTVAGCVTASSLGASIASRTLHVNRKGVGKLMVRCRSGKSCKGRVAINAKGVGASKRFSIGARKAKALTLKFSKKEVRKIFKKKRIRTRAKLKVGGKTTSRSITIVPKR
jgi:hypothetical protein